MMAYGFKECLLFLVHSAFLSSKGYVVKKIKYGREFYKYLCQLEESQWHSQERIRELQNTKLRSLITQAYNYVPYYNRVFKEHGILPEDIQDAQDLKKIPVLTKKVLRANPDDFIARNFTKKFLISGWTTGNSGTPINAFRSRPSVVFENAILCRQRRWAGIDIGCRKVAVWGTIWSNVIVPSTVKRPPFWRKNIADNQLLMSYFHMSDETLPLYFEKMKQFQPEFIEGFPSTLLTLAKFLKRNNQVFPVKAVFTSSEMLYDVHRKEIEESFRTKIFDLYGQAERVAAATECPEHQGLHVNPEYGIFELIKDGKSVPDGESGEITGTGLNNYAMPLIRYQTGDMAQFSTKKCPCGREMPLLAFIEGRKGECIINPEGRVIPGSGVMGAFHGIDNIRESQIIQETADAITLKIVKNNPAADIQTDLLVSKIRTCLGDSIKIDVSIVDSLDKSESIKRKWVVSKIASGLN